MKLEYKDLGFSFDILNVYGPYLDRITYWEQLAVSEALSDPLLLINGDLNVTLSLREVWGPTLSSTLHAVFLLSFLEAPFD
jgi:hypothetical protein